MELHELILSLGESLKDGGSYRNEKNENTLLLYTDVTSAAYEAYRAALLAADVALYSENCIADNRFATCVTATDEVHLCFYPTLKELRVIYGKRGYLPATKMPDVGGDHPLTVTQMGLVEFEAGESDVITLSDGSFLILDGGKKNDTDRDHLLEFLYAHKPAHHAKPHIVAWLISHAHNDHIHLCQEFLIEYGDRVELSLFGYNFPDLDTEWCAAEAHQVRWQNRMKEILDTHFPNTPIWVMHSGQKLLLPGCEAEFLMTWEDFWPRPMKTTNQNSFCVRFTFSNGKTFMAPSDAWRDLVEPMTGVYGDYLKSDVLQATHHGLAGGFIPFYERVAPEVVLWPTSKARFEALEPFMIPEREKPVAIIRQFSSSCWLLEHVARHYHASETVTIDMHDLSVLK